MNVLVDGRPFVKTAAGISTFLRCSVAEWARQKPEYNFFIFLPKRLDDTLELKNLPSNIIMLDCSCFLMNRLPNILLLLLYVPFLARKYKIDLYYAPVPCVPLLLPLKTKKLIVVHDVVNLEQKKTMELRNRISNKLFFSRSVRTADYIWTNSNYTKERVEHYLPKRKCECIYTGCSVDRNIYKRLQLSDENRVKIKEQYGIKGKSILFVGSLEPRKNLPFLLSIMPELYNKHGIQLVVVGGRGWKNSSIKDIVSQPNYPQNSTVFCGYISNQELAELYNVVDCFVSASLGEGFGMPQLEAMLCGCPVVTAHNTAMIEVARNKTGAETIRGFDRDLWIDSIVRSVNCRKLPLDEELTEYDWSAILNNLQNYLGR